MNLTPKQAAKLSGLAPDGFRRAMSRERAAGRDHRAPKDQWPDARTPLWDEASLRAWLESRPGPGNWGRD